MKTKRNLHDSTNANVRDSVAALIAYLWADESAHWLANGKPDGHIYKHLKMLADWLNAFGDDTKFLS